MTLMRLEFLMLLTALLVIPMQSEQAHSAENSTFSYDEYLLEQSKLSAAAEDAAVQRRGAFEAYEARVNKELLDNSSSLIESLPGGRSQLAFNYHQTAVDALEQFELSGNAEYLKAALDAAGAAIRLDGSQAGYWVNLGLIHTQNSSLHLLRSAEYAEEAFVQALEIRPDDPTVMVLLAERLLERGAYEEALFFFETAVLQESTLLSSALPKMTEAYLLAPLTLRGTEFLWNLRFKRLPSTEELFVSPHILWYSAILYIAMGDYQSARGDLRYLFEDKAVKKYVTPALHESAKQLLAKISLLEAQP